MLINKIIKFLTSLKKNILFVNYLLYFHVFYAHHHELFLLKKKLIDLNCNVCEKIKFKAVQNI